MNKEGKTQKTAGTCSLINFPSSLSLSFIFFYFLDNFSVLSFYLFILFTGFSRQEYWSGFPFLSPVDHILSDLSTILGGPTRHLIVSLSSTRLWSKIMATCHITSWKIDGETVTDFILGGSKITADGDCSHEIKRILFLGRKIMTNLDSLFKSRDMTLPTKIPLVKALVFPVVMYRCASWTIKKAERWRIDDF